jgi:hypothetical protein
MRASTNSQKLSVRKSVIANFTNKGTNQNDTSIIVHTGFGYNDTSIIVHTGF